MPKKITKPNKYRNYCTVKRLHNFFFKFFTALINPQVSIGLRRHRLGWTAASLSPGDAEASPVTGSRWRRLAMVTLYRCTHAASPAYTLSSSQPARF